MTKILRDTRDNTVFTGEFVRVGRLLTLLLFEEDAVLKRNRSRIKPVLRPQTPHTPSLKCLPWQTQSPRCRPHLPPAPGLLLTQGLQSPQKKVSSKEMD